MKENITFRGYWLNRNDETETYDVTATFSSGKYLCYTVLRGDFDGIEELVPAAAEEVYAKAKIVEFVYHDKTAELVPGCKDLQVRVVEKTREEEAVDDDNCLRHIFVRPVGDGEWIDLIADSTCAKMEELIDAWAARWQ